MTEKYLKHWYPLLIATTVLLVFLPSIFTFFTHDDWFVLKISQASSLTEFFSFFNLIESPDNWNYYRPLSTQVFFFLSTAIFGKNPFIMHILLFILFFILLYLVYKFTYLITQSKPTTRLTVFLYSISATHFPHLYFLSNQEVIHGIFYLLSLIYLIKFVTTKIYHPKYGLLTTIFFIAALMSKETAVTLIGAQILTLLYLHYTNRMQISFKQLSQPITACLSILLIYLYLHIFYFGLIEGDSYIWEIHPLSALNSWFWYGLWSLGLPTMFVDYIGPGLRINPNLFQFWSIYAYPILSLAGSIALGILVFIWILGKKHLLNYKYQYLFGLFLFLGVLSPVIFLRWHKYPNYLAIPLIGIMIIMSQLIISARQQISKQHSQLIANLISGVMLAFFIALQLITLKLNFQTSWMTQGAIIGHNVHQHIQINVLPLNTPLVINFYDTQLDQDLPWSPSDQIKLSLSDQNYFTVYYQSKLSATYNNQIDQQQQNTINLEARKFLPY